MGVVLQTNVVIGKTATVDELLTESAWVPLGSMAGDNPWGGPWATGHQSELSA